MLAMLKTLGPQPAANPKHVAPGKTGTRQTRAGMVTRDEVSRLFRHDLDKLSDRAARLSQTRPNS